MRERWNSHRPMEKIHKKRKAHHFGIWAELACCTLLMFKGYRILALRARTPRGEIDIVARRRNLLAFIEVKARAEALSAIESVTPAKRDRLISASQAYLAKDTKSAGLDQRFDLMVVVPWRLPNHMMDAWRA